MKSKRPILMCVVQYADELKAGTLTVADLIGKIDSLGVDGIELRRELWANYTDEVAAARQQIDAASKLVTYATFSTLFSMDAAGHKLLLHDLDTAKALGSPLLRVFPGAVPPDVTDAKWAWAHEAVEHAAALGIHIALENWGKLPGGHLNELTYVLDNIPAETLKVNVDVGNYAMHGEDVLEAIKTLGERVIYAHLKDKPVMNGDSTTYLGGGAFPMDAIVAALEALPQPITYCFEFDGDGEAESRIEKSLAYLREEN